MSKIGIIVNPEKDHRLVHLKNVINCLETAGYTYAVSCCNFETKETFNFCTPDECFQDAKLVLTLGGDGTLLKAASYANRFRVPLLGINLGHLGFLAELEPKDINELPQILNSHFECSNRMMLSVSIVRESTCVSKAVALNDAVIRGRMGKPAHIVVGDGESDLLDYLCDGFIIATPTGSTAYSMSAGGPILDPRSDGIVVTPICPHTLGSRSVVFGTMQQTIYVKVLNADRIQAILECDGSEIGDLREGDVVCICRHDTPLKLVRIQNKSFYKVLNEKISRRML